MTEEDHARLVELERNGKVLIGVDRTVARRFFSSASVSKVYEATGYAPHVENAIFKFVFLAGPVFLLASIIFAFIGYGWWGAIALIAYPVLYFGFQASSSTGGASSSLISILVIFAIGLFIFDPFSKWYLMGSISLFVLSLWCVRMVYVTSAHFFRAMALQNAKLFNLLASGIQLKEIK